MLCTRPGELMQREPWLTLLLPVLRFQSHLEESITRHKAHVQKLEIILRLLDNDELSPEQVTDVKDFVEDYVERNQVRTRRQWLFALTTRTQ